MYRPEIRVLDCTIRDGGLMNDWRFDKAMVKGIFAGLAEAGIDSPVTCEKLTPPRSKKLPSSSRIEVPRPHVSRLKGLPSNASSAATMPFWRPVR